MPPVRSTYRVRETAQLRALNSPGRMAVFAALLEEAPAAAAAVADRLGVSPESVHYHLRALERLGLVREAGRRDTGRRPAVLFAPVARRILLDPRRETAAYRLEKARGCRLLLRRAERELSAVLSGPRVPREHRPRLTRDTARLTDADVARVRRLLAGVDALLRRADRPGNPRRVSLTIALVPVRPAGDA